MTHTEFEDMLDNRLDMCKKTLLSKSEEYATDGDRLHNFKQAAQILNCTPSQALTGMMSKHWVSVLDLVNNKTKPSKDVINEKIGDSINYLLLLEGCLVQEMPDSYKKEMSDEK